MISLGPNPQPRFMADRVLQTTLRVQTAQFDGGMLNSARVMEKFTNDARAMGRFVAQTFGQLATPTERLEMQVAKLDTVLAKGRITAEEHSRAIKRLETDYNRAAAAAIELAKAEQTTRFLGRFNEGRAGLHAGETRREVIDRMSGRGDGGGFMDATQRQQAMATGGIALGQVAKLTKLSGLEDLGGIAMLASSLGKFGLIAAPILALGAGISYAVNKRDEREAQLKEIGERQSNRMADANKDTWRFVEEWNVNRDDRERSRRIRGMDSESLTALRDQSAFSLTMATDPAERAALKKEMVAAQSQLDALEERSQKRQADILAGERARLALQAKRLDGMQTEGRILEIMRQQGVTREVAEAQFGGGPQHAAEISAQQKFNERQQAALDLGKLGERFGADAAKEEANRLGRSADRQALDALLEKSGASADERRRATAALETLEAQQGITREMDRQKKLAMERDQALERDFNRVKSFAQSEIEANKTPEERFADQQKRIRDAVATGQLTDEQARRAFDKSAAELRAGRENATQLAPLLAVGSREAANYLAQLQTKGGTELSPADQALIDAEKQALEAAKETRDAVKDLIATVEESFANVAKF